MLPHAPGVQMTGKLEVIYQRSAGECMDKMTLFYIRKWPRGQPALLFIE